MVVHARTKCRDRVSVGLVDGIGDQADALLDRRLGHGSVAEQQTSGSLASVATDPIRRHAVEPDAGSCRTPNDLGLIDASRQPGEDVEARGRPDGSEFRQVAAQRSEQRVSPGSVDRSHPAQVVIELTPRQEVGEGELLEARRAAVRRFLGRGHEIDQPRRHDEPAEPESHR